MQCINACKDHGIPYYIMQYHAKWQFENFTPLILYSCSVINMSLSSRSQTISRAVLDDKLKNIQHSKYDNYLPFSYNGLADASSLFVASHELWSLPMATNSNSFFRKIFFILSDHWSGRTGWSWKQTNTFWELSGLDWISKGSTHYIHELPHQNLK